MANPEFLANPPPATTGRSDTEERILEAARKIFISKGFEGAKVRDIAAEAGVNLSLLNYYFQSKENIFEIVFKQAMETLLHQTPEVVAADMSLFDKIRRLVSLYIDTLIVNPMLPAFLHYELAVNPARICLDETKRLEVDAMFQIFIDQVELERSRGGLRNDVTAAEIYMDVVSMCVFPFVDKPIFQSIFQIDDQKFQDLMLLRKQKIAENIIRTIQR